MELQALNNIFITLIIFYSLVLILSTTYWWQVKEYRCDRLISWLRFNQGWLKLLKISARKPKFTLRAALILLIALLIVSYSFTLIKPLLLPVIALVSVNIGVLLTHPFVSILTKIKVNQATTLVKKIKPQVIVVTGSYGKTSSKEILYQLLKVKYRVVKTLENENTLLAVARRILKSLHLDTQILLIEAGAYRRGEIKALAKMAPPDIAWITGIAPQHLSLFGSLKNLKKAKYELIQSLKPQGIAVIIEDASSQDLIDWANKDNLKLTTYSANPKISQVGKFSFNLLGHQIPLRGAHLAANVLGAIIIAEKLRIPKSQIKIALDNLSQPHNILSLRKTSTGATVIDNSYSTNPQGFKASLDYLRLFPGKKYLVTPGIIELAAQSGPIHRHLASLMKDIDGLWLTDKRLAGYFNQAGVKLSPAPISETLKKGDTLLIEGRIPQSVKNTIYKI